MQLKINKNTVFKRQPVQSPSLPDEEKFNVTSGAVFDIESYQKIDSHYYVLLKEAIDGNRQWYVYENHANIVVPVGQAEMSLPVSDDFLNRIIRTQQSLGQLIFTEPGEVNIVYVEGVDLDGVVNSDRMNEWNDVRLCYTFDGDEPKLLGKWKATTEPGWKYTRKPLNRDGAFRIAFGQYKAWVLGWHRDHEALVQLWKPGDKLDNGLCCGELKGHRDRNQDGFRTNDPIVVTAGIGINQHHGWDMIRVDGASAGCLVGQSRKGHAEFMAIVKSDVRYKNNPHYVFWTSVLNGHKLV